MSCELAVAVLRLS